MKPNELLYHLKQRRGNKEDMKKEEMDELLNDVHKEEKVIRKERNKTKKRGSVMTTDVTMHWNWTLHTNDRDNITFLSVNINSITHRSQDSNKTEGMRHIFEKNRFNSARLHEVYMDWVQLPPFKTLAQILQRTI